MKFPNKIVIRIVDGLTLKPMLMENILICIHVFAINKNDYDLGPYFSDSSGEIHLTSEILKISADAQMETGLMDYKDIEEASPLVKIEILSAEEIGKLKEGRRLWGIIKKEVDLYQSEQKLLEKIDANNNYYVAPTNIKVLWDEKISSKVYYEIKTEFQGQLP